MSIVTSINDMFGPGGVYNSGSMRGLAWEKPGSLELIYPEGRNGFQIDAGMREYGNVGAYHSATPKHSIRVRMDAELYGQGMLRHPLFADEHYAATATDEFNDFILRATFNNSIAVGSGNVINDPWSADTQFAEGQPGSHGMFVHLYIDGLYWGVYNLRERPDQHFMATYFGGQSDEYDVNHEGE